MTIHGKHISWQNERKAIKKKRESQTQCRKALNPRGWVSLIMQSWSGAPMRKQVDSILLSTVSRQVALATPPADLGWKLKIWTFCLLHPCKGLTSQCRVWWLHALPQFALIWCPVGVLTAPIVSDGRAYSRLVSWPERRLDLCLKRPSFYCLIHFYKRCVSSLAQMGRSPWVRSGWVSVLSVTTFFIQG